jgi:hypothetical protein
MRKVIAICGALFDGASDVLHGQTEILIEGDTISDVSPFVGRPNGAQIIDLRYACASLCRWAESRASDAAMHVG